MKRRTLRDRLFAMAFIITLPILVFADDSGEEHHVDITHETFSATGKLSALLISPVRESSVDQVAAPVVVQTELGAGVSLAVNGSIIPFSQIGKRVTNYTNKTVTYTYYGIVFQPGPNTVAIAALGADSLSAAPTQTTIYGAGPIARVHGALTNSLAADGTSIAQLHIETLDTWGHAARAGSRLKLQLLDGEARLLGGIAPTPAPGDNLAAIKSVGTPIDVTLGDNGSVDVPVQAGLHPGTVHVSVTAEHLTETIAFSIASHARAPLVNGIFSEGVGAVPGSSDGSALAGARKERAAFFGTGAIGKQTNLTVAYDSAQALTPSQQNGEAQSDTSDQPYATYGDASLHGSQAVSNNHLYLRIDKGLSSAGYGQFQKKIGDNHSAASYNQILNGANAALSNKDGSAQISGFRSRDNVAYARAVYNPSQLSSTETNLHPNVVVDSDTITVVTLDRHTGSIVAQTPLVRNIDYAVTYATGEIRFINVPLPYDAAFNPNSIVVQYQYSGNGSNASTSGATIAHRIGKINIQAGLLSANAGDATYSLSTQQIGRQDSHLTWNIAHAHAVGNDDNAALVSLDPTQTFGASAGDAYRGDLLFKRRRASISADFDQTGSGFQNPYGGLTTPGFSDYHIAYVNGEPGNRNETGVTITHTQNAYHGIQNSQSFLRAHVTRTLSPRLKVTTAISSTKSNNATADIPDDATAGSTLQGEVGAEYKATHGLSGTLRRIATLSMTGIGNTAQPGETDLQLEQSLPRKGRIYLRELWTDSPTQSFAVSTLGLTTAATSTHSTAIGLDTPLSCATTITSQYGIDSTGSANTLYSAIGVKTRYVLSPLFSGDVNLQTLNSQGAAAIYGTTLAYKNDGTISTLSINRRSGASAGTAITLNSAAHIANDLSLIAALDEAHTLGSDSTDARIGLTVRPITDTGGALLLAFERRAGVASLYGGGETDTLSFDALTALGSNTEAAARFAYKLDGDSYYQAHTALFAMRLRRQLNASFDVGTEMRTTIFAGHINPISLAIETGLHLGNALRLATGFTMTPSPDTSLAALPTRRGFYMAATSTVNHLFGWGRSPFN